MIRQRLHAAGRIQDLLRLAGGPRRPGKVPRFDALARLFQDGSTRRFRIRPGNDTGDTESVGERDLPGPVPGQVHFEFASQLTASTRNQLDMPRISIGVCHKCAPATVRLRECSSMHFQLRISKAETAAGYHADFQSFLESRRNVSTERHFRFSIVR